jgi:hypothetical protein
MGTAENNPSLKDELEGAFSEWDENAPIAQIAQGSQPHALPTTSRTTTVSDPVTTRALADSTRRYVPRSLEEALTALADGLLAISDGIPRPAR